MGSTDCTMSETENETFKCDICGMSFNSESQMNAHKVSVHTIASGEVTTR
jgi:DNA gyrase inhibitor GyrI